jgi:hypothetical protein
MQHNREPARNRAGMLFAFLAMAIVVASVIGTLAATGRFSGHIATGSKPGVLQDALRIDTVRTAHIYCPSSPSFSPDGTRLAVLGTGEPCTDPAATLPRKGQHELAIYSVATGQLQSIFELDHYFLPNTIPECSYVPVHSLQFTGLGWSPDGLQFGILYAAFQYATFDIPNALSPDSESCSGLLLLSVNPGTAVAAEFIDGDAGFFDAPSNTYSGYPIWNVLQQRNIPLATVTPSLVYGWTQNGYPQSVWPLTGQLVSQLTIAGPGYPVGNPSTDSTYTLWQPGLVAGPQVFAGGAAASSGDYVFVAQFPTWIPPSGQVVTMIVAGVQLPSPQVQYPAPTAPTPSSPTAVPLVPLPPSLTQVPARDAALVAVQKEIGEDGWAMTAWNDEGSILAAIDCSSPQTERLELRETGAGALVGTAALELGVGDAGCQVFNFSQALGDYPNPNLSLQWSPDGTHILLSDQTANLLTLWRVATFP